MAYGLSFQPGAQQNGTGGDREQAAGRTTPVQQAIRLLSLRLPSVLGARAIAPQALLGSQGSAGLATGGMSLDEFLRRLMAQSGAGIPPEAQGVFNVPSPQEDRERGVSRELPRPGGTRVGRPVQDPPRPPRPPETPSGGPQPPTRTPPPNVTVEAPRSPRTPDLAPPAPAPSPSLPQASPLDDYDNSMFRGPRNFF